jgi:phage head maturation protease
MLLHRATATATADTDARTITARLCNYDEPRRVSVADGTFTETFQRGSVTLADRVHVTDVHTGNLVGRATAIGEDDYGPTITLDIARTAAGSDLLALVDAGVLDSVSMEFEPGDDEWNADRTAVTRRSAVVHGVAFAFRPAHAAPILTRETTGEHAMTDTVTVMPDTAPVPAVAPTVHADTVTPEVLERSMTAIRDELARATTVPAGLVYASPAHPLAEFRSLVDYADAVYSSADAPALAGLLHRALVDQVTTDNPGVMPPGWVTTVYGILERSRPTIESFGTEPLPPAGMDVNWPYFDGDLLTLIGVQATEKAPITSVKVSLEKGTADLVTYAGGSDISYQLIRRSAPSYRDAYLRIMFAAYAAVTDNAAADAMAATAGRGHEVLDLATMTSADLRAALFAASLKVETATGQPASFGLASSDVFAKIGGFENLWPAQYGTTNTSGTADAASLQISVSGLPIRHDPFLPAGSLFVSNGVAGGWFEEGPMTVAAEDVEKLGQNVAVWGMGTWGATIPAGIVQLSATAPVATGTSRRASKKSDD